MTKKILTLEQKQKLAENLKKAREAKRAKANPPASPEKKPEDGKGWIGHHTMDREIIG